MRIATAPLRLVALVSLAVAMAAGSCANTEPVPMLAEPSAPAVTPAVATIKRLTRSQYRNAVRDLLGDVAVPIALEPDAEVDGFLLLGGGTTSVSALGVERYESAAFDLASQALKDTAIAKALVPCAPADDTKADASCVDAFVRSFGRRAFRRPLTDEEAARYTSLATLAGDKLGSFRAGVEFALAGLLESPHFLFRVELGEPVPGAKNPEIRRYSSFEMASRLSFFLWGTTPDDALLDAAARGDLLADDGLAHEVDRMLMSSRARAGLRTFFEERFALYRLDDLVKDTTLFSSMSADLGPDAREETLSSIEEMVFDRDEPYPNLLTRRRTIVNRRLASLYGVPASSLDGFAPVTLPENGARAGLLGNASILALYSHSTATSSTLRGKFTRTALLCATIPPPPADVDTSLPEPSEVLPTLRDRMSEHVTNPVCASCHTFLDPIGLGLENFDAIGRFRQTEQDVLIDASGELDGTSFGDARGLGAAIAQHPDFPACLARHLYRFALGVTETDTDEPLIAWLTERFIADGQRVRPLLRRVVMSDGFRRVKEAP
ncbi:MAG: DUF1592 domain-containing protein [Myxococcales bacterium]|nr:DUF1592 domain-containing protein [Myxococcales bacterium]